MKELRVAMIGAGFMGKAHALAYASLPMFFWPAPARPVRALVVEATEPQAREAAERLGFERWTDDWQRAVTADEIDVVDVCTPNFLHKEAVLLAAAHGKHIICEKPLATNADDAKEMLAAVERAGVVHATAFNFRRTPAVVYAKKLISDGVIGDVLDFRGTYLQDWPADPSFPRTWRFDRKLAGTGAIGDIGSHVIDFARYLVGEIAQVCATANTYVRRRPLPGSNELRTVDVDDQFTSLIRFAGGQTGSIEATRNAYGRHNYLTFEIHGTAGSILFDYEKRDQLRLAVADEARDRRGFTTIYTGPDHPYGDALWPGPALGNGYAETKIIEVYEFFRSIAEQRPADPSFVDGYRAARVVEAIAASTESGSWTQVRS